MAKAHMAESKIMARRVIKCILDILSSLIVAATSLSKRSCNAAEPGSRDLVNFCIGLLYQVHHKLWEHDQSASGGITLFRRMRASCLSCRLLTRTMIVDVKGTYLPLCSPCLTIASMRDG